LAGNFADVRGPFATHYTFPVLFDTSSNYGCDPFLSVPEDVFSLSSSLFDWTLRPAPSRELKVGTVDLLALREPRLTGDESGVDYAIPDGDEVSSTLWLLRRELLHQVQVNHDRKKGLRAACVAAGAFDKEAQQKRMEVLKEQERTLAEYRRHFPSSHLTEQETEQARSSQAAHNAAQRAGKSVVSTTGGGGAGAGAGAGAGGGVRSHHHHHHPHAHQSSSGTPRRRTGGAASAAAAHHNRSPSTPTRNNGVFGAMFARAGKAPRSSNSPPKSPAAAATAAAVAAGPGTGGASSNRASRPAEELVRACVNDLVGMVEQIDRSQSVVQAKSERVAQLRERREKRQKDMAEWEEQRTYKDKCHTVLAAIVAQIELDVIDEAAAAAAADQAQATKTSADDAQPQPMDVDGPAASPTTTATAAAIPAVTKAVAANCSPCSCSCPAREDDDQEERKQPCACCRSATPPTAAAVSESKEDQTDTDTDTDTDAPMRDVVVAASSALLSPAPVVAPPPPTPTPTRLPLPHLYVEPVYCPREKRPYSLNTPYARCDHCGQWWHTRCMGFLTPEDVSFFSSLSETG
jgi:hypothetical protein